MKELTGVLPVISTPFTADLDIDRSALAREIDWLILNGSDGLVMAMVSELPRLTSTERITLGHLILDFAAGRVPVVLSVGAESTREAKRLTRDAVGAGAAAVMANPPLTVFPSREQLADYFSTIIEEAGAVPVVIQDASGYIGRPLDLGLLAGLLDRYGPARVLFKPEAQPLGPRLTELHQATGGQARVFDGSGGAALADCYRRGIVGTMPGADLVWAIAGLWRALTDQDLETTYRISSALAPILAQLSDLDSYVAMEKYLLVKQGVFQHEHRLSPTAFVLDDIARLETDRLFDGLTSAAGGPRALPA